MYSFPLRLLITLLLAATTLTARPESITRAPPATLENLQSLDSRIRAVEASTDQDEETRNQLLTMYKKARNFLKAIEDHNAATAQYMEAMTTAPEKTRLIENQLKNQPAGAAKLPSGIDDNSTVAEIRQALLGIKADMASKRATLSNLKQQLTEQTDRTEQAREKINQAKQRQQIIHEELSAREATSSDAVLNEATRIALRAEYADLDSEIRMLDQEMLSLPVRLDLLNAKIDQTSAESRVLNTRVSLMENLANVRRGSEALRIQQDVTDELRNLASRPPGIRRLAEKNAELARQLTTIANDQNRISSGDDQASRQAELVSQAYVDTQNQLRIAGLAADFGKVLLAQRQALPDPRDLQRQARKRRNQYAEYSLLQIQNREELRTIKNHDEYIRTLNSQSPQTSVEATDPDLLHLVETREKLLRKSVSMISDYRRSLSELELAQQRLADQVSDFAELLDKHLLWMRSAPILSTGPLKEIPAQFAWLVSPTNWSTLASSLFDQFSTSPLAVTTLVLLAALFAATSRLRQLLMGTASGRRENRDFSATISAVGLTLLLALRWPLLLLFLVWQLRLTQDTSGFSAAMAIGLLKISRLMFSYQFIRFVCHPRGLAEKHFQWPAGFPKALRRIVDRFILIFLPAGFLTAVYVSHETNISGGGIGRLALIAALLVMALFFYRLSALKPLRLLTGSSSRLEQPGFVLRCLWKGLTIVLPVVLAIAAFSGYVYTASVLGTSLLKTVNLIFLLILLQQSVQRWLILTRRKLALRAARGGLGAVSQADVTPVAVDDSAPMAEEEEEIDLGALKHDAGQFLNTVLWILFLAGVWNIWSEVLPALGIFNNIVLWHHTTVEAGSKVIHPVTLGDTAIAAFIAVFAVVLANRLPSFLEMILLQRTSMSSSNRYTLTTITNYLIIAIGIVLFFNQLGGSWSQIQWLVAAMSVGIGFGLQEIVANFISGIIVLFERPIRVGDVITVGNLDGEVVRIRIRATTIRDWDRKELVVPNKAFITDQLINWTLADQTTRLVIPVGLAYGGDVELALKLMMQAAENNDRVLTDPEPSVIFDDFGDNALLLKLRCFVGTTADRMVTATELRTTINTRFNAAGLIIAFPQRDIHLDTSEPLELKILHPSPADRAG